MLSRRELLLTSGALLIGCGPAKLPATAPSSLLGKPMPKIRKRRTVTGARVGTAANQNKITVVKFFAKYCEPCKRTLPAAERLHRANRDSVLLIGVAEDEYRAQVEETIKLYGLSFPVIHDRGNVLIGRFRTAELPATFVADASGRVRWVGGPKQSERDLHDAVAYLQAN